MYLVDFITYQNDYVFEEIINRLNRNIMEDIELNLEEELQKMQDIYQTFEEEKERVVQEILQEKEQISQEKDKLFEQLEKIEREVEAEKNAKEAEQKRRIAKMLEAKLDINLIAQISNLTVEEVQVIIKEMEDNDTEENV